MTLSAADASLGHGGRKYVTSQLTYKTARENIRQTRESRLCPAAFTTVEMAPLFQADISCEW